MITRSVNMLVLVMLLAPLRAFSQEPPKAAVKSTVGLKAAPKASVIAERFAAATLDHGMAKTEVVTGKKVTVTPVANQRGLSPTGQAVAVVETELAGSTTGLPPGKYQIYVAKISDQWRAFAESGGKIVAESSDVQVAVINESVTEKPTISDFSMSLSIKCKHGCTIKLTVKW